LWPELPQGEEIDGRTAGGQQAELHRCRQRADLRAQRDHGQSHSRAGDSDREQRHDQVAQIGADGRQSQCQRHRQQQGSGNVPGLDQAGSPPIYQ